MLQFSPLDPRNEFSEATFTPNASINATRRRYFKVRNRKIMKAKKQLCAVKSNMIKRIKKLQSNQNQSTGMKLKKLAFVDNVKIFKNRVSPESCVGGFHEAIKPMLVIGQFFGVMPVSNVTAESPCSLKFSWKSLRVLFALLVTASCGFEAILTVYWALSKKLEFGKMVPLVFYVTNFLSFVCFFNLAKQWPELMVKC